MLKVILTQIKVAAAFSGVYLLLLSFKALWGMYNTSHDSLYLWMGAMVGATAFLMYLSLLETISKMTKSTSDV